MRINLSLGGKRGRMDLPTAFFKTWVGKSRMCWFCPWAFQLYCDSSLWAVRKMSDKRRKQGRSDFYWNWKQAILNSALWGKSENKAQVPPPLALASQPVFNLELSPWRALFPHFLLTKSPISQPHPHLFYRRLWMWASVSGYGATGFFFFLCKCVR